MQLELLLVKTRHGRSYAREIKPHFLAADIVAFGCPGMTKQQQVDMEQMYKTFSQISKERRERGSDKFAAATKSFGSDVDIQVLAAQLGKPALAIESYSTDENVALHRDDAAQKSLIATAYNAMIEGSFDQAVDFMCEGLQHLRDYMHLRDERTSEMIATLPERIAQAYPQIGRQDRCKMAANISWLIFPEDLVEQDAISISKEHVPNTPLTPFEQAAIDYFTDAEYMDAIGQDLVRAVYNSLLPNKLRMADRVSARVGLQFNLSEAQEIARMSGQERIAYFRERGYAIPKTNNEAKRLLRKLDLALSA